MTNFHPDRKQYTELLNGLDSAGAFLHACFLGTYRNFVKQFCMSFFSLIFPYKLMVSMLQTSQTA